MVFVKWDILSSFKIPISVKLFGQNKTWRGFILLPLLSAFFALLGSLLAGPFLGNHLKVILFGIGMGIVYLLAELPNSFMKRRLGIKEGQTSDRFKWFFVVIDQADSAIGCMVAYRILIPIPPLTMILTIISGTIIHLFINVGLYLLRIRKNPF
jgi:hypothetical protein